MDPWAWSVLAGWTADRAVLPPGPLFCVIDGPTRGRAWSATAVRAELRHLAAEAGVRRRFAPHQLRHAHAVELLHEGIPLPLIQRQLGHAYLSTTGTYLQGIDTREIVDTVSHRRPPVIPASAGRGNNENHRGRVVGASRAPVHHRAPVRYRAAGERYRCCPAGEARVASIGAHVMAPPRQSQRRRPLRRRVRVRRRAEVWRRNRQRRPSRVLEWVGE